MSPPGPGLRRFALAALLICAALCLVSLSARRVKPVAPAIAAQPSSAFTSHGEYPGERFVHANRVRTWGSWSGSDASEGRLVLGPFPAPGILRFAVSGYPRNAGNQVYAELVATNERTVLHPENAGERWHITSHPLPQAWHDQAIRLVAVDGSTAWRGWLGLSEPIQGGFRDSAALAWESFATFSLNGILLATLWLTAAIGLARKQGLSPPWIPLVAFGAVAFAGYLVFWAYFIHPILGRIASTVLLLAATGACVSFWRARPPIGSETIAVGGLTVAVGTFYLGLLHLFPSRDGFYRLAATRFVDNLPADNQLPAIVAARLFDGGNLREPLGDWLTSDRPPLQSGWQLLTWPGHAALGFDGQVASGTASLWFQLAWVAAAWGLLRSLGLSVVRTSGWIAALAATGFFAQHTVFTWPKLASGALACGAFGLWVIPRSELQTLRHTLIGAALAALAWLAHGGVAFSFLALLPWILWRCVHGEWRRWLAVAALLIVLLAPWLAYQKLYDPPGNRLFKWHLAGQVAVDPRGTWETIRSAYAALGWNEMVQRKTENLRNQLGGGWLLLADLSPARATQRRNFEFYSGTLRGLAWWAGAIALLPWAIARVARDVQAPERMRVHVALLAWAMLTIVLWCLLMFSGGSAIVHQGSFAAMLALFALLSATYEMVGRGWLALISVVGTTTFAFTWAVSNRVVHGEVDLPALVVVAISGALLAWRVFASFRPTPATP